jgi:hypothetical protein
VEALRHRPTDAFARRADEALDAGGTLMRLYEQYDLLRSEERLSLRSPGAVHQPLAKSAELIVEREEAEQRLDGEWYTMTIRRLLYNGTREPVVRFFVRINADDAIEASLAWREVQLTARCGDLEMDIDKVTDRPELKEAWLLFRNQAVRFPLQPGQRGWIEYSYRVPARKWGPWFQRALRVPTRFLSVSLVFPAELTPAAVWGIEMSPYVDAAPLFPIVSERRGNDVVYRWETTAPRMEARYRLEWRGTADPSGEVAIGGKAGARAQRRP